MSELICHPRGAGKTTKRLIALEQENTALKDKWAAGERDRITILSENLNFRAENSRLREALEKASLVMHNVSSRPCPTCREITEVSGKPFGCYYHQSKRSNGGG